MLFVEGASDFGKSKRASQIDSNSCLLTRWLQSNYRRFQQRMLALDKYARVSALVPHPLKGNYPGVINGVPSKVA